MVRWPPFFPRLAALSLVWPAVALPGQGVINPTMLRAPVDGESAPPRSGPAFVAATARAAIVYVCVEVDGPRGKFAIERSSSGVVVDASGLVLTWRHLVQEAVGATDKQLLVQLDDAANTRLPATLVRADDATGLALLRVAPPAGGLAAIATAPQPPRAGDAVVVLCRPEGKEMFAFAGVASAALAAVPHRGVTLPQADLFLADSRNDERCDGGAVVDAEGRLLGLYAAQHVQRDKSEPTLEDLQRPSFGIVLDVAAARRAFAAEWPAAAARGAVGKAVAGGAAVQAVAPSVVGVWAGEGDWPAPAADDPGGVQRRAGLGSGVVLSRNGLVVANLHVCRAGTPRLRLQDGRIVPGKIVQSDVPGNLALLAAELPAGVTLQAAVCAADDDALLGEVVLAVGNPFGRAPLVSAGVVSARRDREGGRIQADANLGAANGGGAVIDAAGRLLGISDAGAEDPIAEQFRRRGDRATTETNLSTFVGIARVRRVFKQAIEAAAAADESIRAPAAATAEQLALRTSPLTAMVQKVKGAMLNIEIKVDIAKKNDDDPFAAMEKPVLMTMSLGSGVVIDRSGLALSNWHVVDDATNPDGSPVPGRAVTASVFGGKTYPVRVLSISRENDLSLLQIELPPGEELTAVELGSAEALALGEPVAAIGNPHGRANTITSGIVSAKNQELRVRGRWAKLEHLIETDAAINGGNSGGALLDMRGRLVGINSAGGGTFNNKGYAIDVDHVRKTLLSLLLAAYKLRSPELGLRPIDDAGKVLVMDVDPNGPAAAAGVQSGDRIQSLGGEPITWSPGFARTLAKATPGVAIDLVVERRGEQKTFTLQPLAAEAWAVVRQSGLLCRNFGYAEDPDRVQQAVVALHRHLTGDPTSAPASIPEQLVVVSRVFPGHQSADIQPGDLLLAFELLRADTGDPVSVRLTDLAKLRDLWNARELGTYEGTEWKCWIARGAEVRTVEITAKRLFW